MHFFPLDALTSFRLWKAFMQEEDYFLHKVSDVLAVFSSH